MISTFHRDACLLSLFLFVWLGLVWFGALFCFALFHCLFVFGFACFFFVVFCLFALLCSGGCLSRIM